MQKVVNTILPKNDTFHHKYHLTTFGVSCNNDDCALLMTNHGPAPSYHQVPTHGNRGVVEASGSETQRATMKNAAATARAFFLNAVAWLNEPSSMTLAADMDGPKAPISSPQHSLPFLVKPVSCMSESEPEWAPAGGHPVERWRPWRHYARIKVGTDPQWASPGRDLMAMIMPAQLGDDDAVRHSSSRMWTMPPPLSASMPLSASLKRRFRCLSLRYFFSFSFVLYHF